MGGYALRMHVPFPLRPLAWVFVLLAAALTLVAPASAEPVDGAVPEQVTLAAHYAGLLSGEPEGAAVVVDRATGGPVRHTEIREELHAVFDPLEVPYYVVVTPFVGAGTPGGMDEILPAVHDRIGADGFYAVLAPEGNPVEMRAYGVDVPVRAATDAVRDDPGLDYDAPVTEVSRVLAAALADPAVAGEAAAERERAERVPQGWQDFLDDIDPARFNGPENLGFLVGGVAGFSLTVGGWMVWRSVRRARLLPAVAAALGSVAVAVAAVAGPYPYVLNAPVGEHEVADPMELVRLEEPYVLSTERVEYVAGRLAEEPLYVDPLFRGSREGLAALTGGLDGAGAPVYAAVLNGSNHDEAEGDPEVLAAALASVADREGFYLVAVPGFDSSTAVVGAAAHGLEIDGSALWFSVYDIEEATPARALTQAVAALEEVEFGSASRFEPLFADDEPNLPGPRTERYWSGGMVASAIIIGPFLAGLAIGAWYLTALLWRARRSARAVVGDRALRRMALRETGRLGRVLADGGQRVPDALMPQAEAALMLMDREPSGLDLLGTVVLSRRVLAASEEGASESPEPCSVNPLHPMATARAAPFPRGQGGRPMLCADCAALTADQRERRVLKLRTRSTAHSYMSKPKSPWIRHRFGADRPDRMLRRLMEERDLVR
ncbi:hypothetical protein [Nocardiopsis sp. LOL_012]|uniref:hypothetical protein n=1 Tax=Nocardiopsis sp. LOL_012 TaxID=3345409 RepID=UPI003A85E8BE